MKLVQIFFFGGNADFYSRFEELFKNFLKLTKVSNLTQINNYKCIRTLWTTFVKFWNLALDTGGD